MSNKDIFLVVSLVAILPIVYYAHRGKGKELVFSALSGIAVLFTLEYFLIIKNI